MALTLVIHTPVGDLTRKTDKMYSHAVVWSSPRAMRAFERRNEADASRSGVAARWIKDRGYGVTWHGSLVSASRSVSPGYKWDADNATLLGIYPVYVQY